MVLLLIVAALFLLHATTDAAAAGWLPAIKPAYCNIDPTKSAIEDLTVDEENQVGELKQVLTMIRHGSRTPWGKEPCWKDYDIPWSDCNVTELMLASPAKIPYVNTQTIPEPWLFRKVYNAFTNVLGGMNCFTGQLLAFGYDQEQENGRILKKAYLTNPKFNLFNGEDKWDNGLIKENAVFFRSDDEQRTLMSGQTLLSTFFDQTKPKDKNNDTVESVVTWHTGDEALDQIAPNSQACPALSNLQNIANHSPEFIQHNTSTQINGLTTQLDDVLGSGYWTWYNVIDCFMTAVCNDYPIPDNPINNAKMTQKLFNDTIENVEYVYAYNSNYNNSRYSKLAMGHTIYEMRTRLEKAINNDNDAIKFGLWSAHDTSIMPLLSALLEKDGNNTWDGKWAQYAALFTIELYSNKINPNQNNDLFRLTYNGKPIRLPACQNNLNNLCDINNLISSMSYAQNIMPECSDIPTNSNSDSGKNSGCTNSNDETVDGMSGWDWTGLCLASALLGAVGGAAIVNYKNDVNRNQKASDVSDLISDDSSVSLHQDLVKQKFKNDSDSANPLHI